MRAWIGIVPDDAADDDLRGALAMARTPHGTVDNVMQVHSLRPATMRGHMALYRAALHNEKNRLEPWLAETLGSYVSMLNECAYSLANHWANARHLIADEERAEKIETALANRRPEDVFDGRELGLMRYAEKLTLAPGKMEFDDVEGLRKSGLDDGEILEANQIIAYFNYANRHINGLGVTTEGDVVGYYSSD